MTPEELLKEVGEPFGYIIPHYADYPDVFFKHPLPKGYSALMARTKLYTSDQLAAAVARATKPLEDSLAVVKKDRADLYMETLTLRDQLAKAEQRVAEAIVDMLQQKHRNCFGAHSFYLAASVATANGEWRKFVKEM